jgi:hypothetical protein
MSTRSPRHFAEKIARPGDAMYEREIRSHVEKTNRGKVVATSWPTSQNNCATSTERFSSPVKRLALSYMARETTRSRASSAA